MKTYILPSLAVVLLIVSLGATIYEVTTCKGQVVRNAWNGLSCLDVQSGGVK